MNPIENLWGLLVNELNNARTVEGLPFKARDANNADQLFQLVTLKWEQLRNNEGYLQRLVDRMPRRLQAVIDAQGGWTGY